MTITKSFFNFINLLGKPSGIAQLGSDGKLKASQGPSESGKCYVDKNGDDTDGDGSQLRPYLTLQKALNEVAAGNFKAIYLGAGQFDETAILTIGNNTPTNFTIMGAGMWATDVRAIKVDATGTPNGAGYNFDFMNFSMKINHTDPCIELVAKSTLSHFHLDMMNTYMSRSGAGLVAMKMSGTESPDTGIRLTGGTIFVDGDNACCLDLPFGIVQFIGGGLRSSNGPEIKTTTGAKYVILTNTLLGEGMGGIGKAYPDISIVKTATSGLSCIIAVGQAIYGTGHFVDVSGAGAGTCSIISDVEIAIRAGSGGINNPTGAVVVGSIIDAATGAAIPVTAGVKINLKKASTVAYDNSTTHMSATDVQAAIDELYSLI